jgi:hypothetical protein
MFQTRTNQKGKTEMRNVNLIQREIALWAEKTFGPGDRFDGIMSHLKEEVGELRDSDGHIEEFADCLILLLNAAEQRGITWDILTQTVEIKMKVNKLRKWGNKQPCGKVNHMECE